MSAIIAHEWYRENRPDKRETVVRDFETDAAEAFAEDEKIYE
jgi:hypothetical protein